MRGLTSTIALVVVLAGLGAYIYFVDSKRPAGSPIEEKQKVFAIESDKIDEIRLTSDKETSLLRKVEGTWRMIEPQPGEVDQNEVSGLATNLATIEVNRVVDENAADLTAFGLADPRIKIAFKGQNGAAGEVFLGDKTATQSDLYAVKPNEKRVFLVSAFQETTFAKKPFDLSDKRVLKFERDKVDAVEIGQGGPAIHLARSGSDWMVKAPVQSRGDYSTIEGLLTRLSSTNMTKVVDGGSAAPSAAAPPGAKPQGPAQYGFDKPQATVTLGAGSTRASLEIGKEEDGAVYARDLSRNIVFTIDPAVATDLKKPADEYRDKDVFEFRNFNAERVRITRGAETYEFQKIAGTGENATEKWQRVNQGAAAADVDATKMDDLMSKLTGLRAQSFTELAAKTGTDQPALVVAASYDGGKFERARFGRSGADAFAVRDGEPGAFKLDADSYEQTVKALDAVLAPATPAAPTTAKP